MNKQDITKIEDALKDAFSKEHKQKQGNIESELKKAFQEKKQKFPEIKNVEETIGYSIAARKNRPLTLEEVMKLEDEKRKKAIEKKAKEREKLLNEAKKQKRAIELYQAALDLEKQPKYKENGITAKDILVKAREKDIKNFNPDTFDIIQQAIDLAIENEENIHGEFNVKPSVYEKKMIR